MKLAKHPRIGTLTVSKVLPPSPPAMWSVDAGALAHDALRQMAEHDLGALVAVEGEHFAGMFTERDYLRQVVLGNSGAAHAPVAELISPSPFFATPQQTAEECLVVMTENRLHHLPVLENGRAIGLLSLVVLLHALLAHYERAFAAFELDQRILFLQGTYSC